MSGADVRRVPVELGARAYEVQIGPALLDRAGELLSPYLPRGRTAVVTDSHVADHHGERLAAALEAGGVAVDMIVLEPGEQTKSFLGLEQLSERLLALKLDRSDRIVTFGGRRHRRSRRFCSGHLQARHRLYPDPHHTSCPGGQLGGGQDRHRHAGRQKPDRRLPSADHGPRRHRCARHSAPSRDAGRVCGGAEIRPSRRRGFLRLAGGQRRGGAGPRAGRARLCDRPLRGDEGRHRGAGRARHRVRGRC